MVLVQFYPDSHCEWVTMHEVMVIKLPPLKLDNIKWRSDVLIANILVDKPWYALWCGLLDYL